MNNVNGIDLEIEKQQSRLERLQIVREALLSDAEKFENVVARTVRAWGDTDLVWDWLCKPLLRFNDRMPLEAVLDGDEDQVLQLINAIEHGVYL